MSHANPLIPSQALVPAHALATRYSPSVLGRAQNVRLLFLDVDGVFTDGGLYFGESGESLKRFSVLDGFGLKLLRQAGVQVAVITGRDSPALRARLAALKIEHVHYGTEDKAPAAQQVLGALNLDWGQAAAMGDDWPDLPVLTRCALATAPANAHTEVLSRVHYICQLQGGSGAIREVCDLLLSAKGAYTQTLQPFLA